MRFSKLWAPVLASMLLLSGCVATAPKQQEGVDFWNDHKTRVDAARASGQKLAPVFLETYNKMAALPDFYDKTVWLKFVATLAKHAHEVDTGVLTVDEMKIKIAELDSARRAESEDLARLNEQERRRRIQQYNANMANTLTIINATQPRPLPMPSQQTCDTRFIGGMYRTQCY